MTINEQSETTIPTPTVAKCECGGQLVKYGGNMSWQVYLKSDNCLYGNVSLVVAAK
jgi:hypothetical protein